MSTRYSRQRETIYDIVYNDESHPCVDDIYRQAKKIIPNISLGTVYRNLDVLVKEDRLNSFVVGERTRYDARLTPHSHFICNYCGRIEDVDLSISDVDYKDYSIEEIQIILRGCCNQCRN